MPEQARVTSVEALEAFKASLILYLAKAGPTLEEVRAEIVRTRVWIQSDRRSHWENQVRRRRRELEEAQQALFRARLSNFSEATADGRATVHKARRALEEAETKRKRLKVWNRELDSRAQPLLKQLEALSTLLAHHMPKAVAYLTQAADTLSAYAGVISQSSTTEETRPIGEPSPGIFEESEQPGHSSIPKEESG